MAFNSIQIIQEIRQELDMMIEYVTGASAQTATADQIERGLFQRLLQLGARLLALFVVSRAQKRGHRDHALYYSTPTPHCGRGGGQPLPAFHGDRRVAHRIACSRGRAWPFA